MRQIYTASWMYDRRSNYSTASIILLVIFLFCLQIRSLAQMAPPIDWNKAFGGSNADELVASVRSTDGGYLLAGSSASGISGAKSEASRGNYDYWIVKISSSGIKQWDKTYGGTDEDRLTAVIQTPDGGYLLAGYSKSGLSGDKTQAGKGAYDYWVIKIDGTGAKQWDKTYGGSLGDHLSAVTNTLDGGFLLAGYSSSGISGDKTGLNRSTNVFWSDYWVIKITSTGSKQWDRTLGGGGNDELTALVQQPDGSYLVAGYSNSQISSEKSQNSRGDYDYWIIRLSSSGDRQWDKTFGGAQADFLSSIVRSADGSILLAGHSYSTATGEKTQASWGFSDYWVVKISNTGLKQWDKRFGGTETDILKTAIQTSDNGYLLAGSSLSGLNGDKTENSRGGYDYWLVKISSTGNKFWDKRFGGSNSEQLSYVTLTSSGAYFLSGYSTSGISGDKTETNKGSNDYWTVKTTIPAVYQEWDKRFGGTNNDELSTSIKTTDGGYLLAGSSLSSLNGDKSQASQGNYDYWIIKINSSGSKQWDKRFGGSNTDHLNSVIQTADGGYLLGGYSSSGLSGDKSQAGKGNADYWIVKISNTGTKQWDKTFGGSGEDVLSSVVTSTDGGFLLAGYSNSGIGGDKSQSSKGFYDFWVVKVSSTGLKQWDKTYGGSNTDFIRSAIRTSDGGYLLGGESNSNISGDKSANSKGDYDYWVVKISSSGLKQWDRTFGGSLIQHFKNVIQTTDGGYLLAGYSESGMSGDIGQASRGAQDCWIVKLNSSGGQQWNKLFGGSNSDYLFSVIQTPDGGYLLGGESASNISGEKYEASRGSFDYWIVRMTSTGAHLWNRTFGGSSFEDIHTVILTPDKGYLLCGTSNSGTSGDRTQPSQGLTDYWIVKTTPDPRLQLSVIIPPTTSLVASQEESAVIQPLGVSAAKSSEALPVQLTAYPNPAADKINLSIQWTEGKDESTRLQVYDQQGKCVISFSLGRLMPSQQYHFEINTSKLASGVYIAQLITGNSVKQFKFIKIN